MTRKHLLRYIFFFIIIDTILLILLMKLELIKTQNFNRLSGSCKGCNVVIINIDNLRADALNCDEKDPVTPNICRFSQKAFNLKNHISHSSYTLPSFVSTFTSLYPMSHNLWNEFHRRLNYKVPTLSSILKKNGYYSVYLGEIKTGSQILSNWFDDEISIDIFNKKDKEVLINLLNNLSQSRNPFLMYIFISNLHFPYLSENDNTLDANDVIKKPDGIPTTSKEYEDSISDYILNNYEQVFSQEAIEKNKTLFSNRNIKKNKKKIYSLYKKYLDLDITERNKNLQNAWDPYYYSFINYIDTNNPDHIKYLKTTYINLLKKIDYNINTMLSLLLDDRFNSNTVIVLNSSHGEEFYEHGGFAHDNSLLYQELIHTPMIVKIPNSRPKVIKTKTQSIDLMPTILELLGIDFSNKTQGKSLLPLLIGTVDYVNIYQIAQKNNYTVAFIKNDWKLLIKDYKHFELYNIKIDPHEEKNLANINSNKVRQLFEEYKQIINSMPRFERPDPFWPKEIDEQKKKKMLKQGYF